MPLELALGIRLSMYYNLVELALDEFFLIFLSSWYVFY